jgi:hypothetical protein
MPFCGVLATSAGMLYCKTGPAYPPRAGPCGPPRSPPRRGGPLNHVRAPAGASRVAFHVGGRPPTPPEAALGRKAPRPAAGLRVQTFGVCGGLRGQTFGVYGENPWVLGLGRKRSGCGGFGRRVSDSVGFGCESSGCMRLFERKSSGVHRAWRERGRFHGTSVPPSRSSGTEGAPLSAQDANLGRTGRVQASGVRAGSIGLWPSRSARNHLNIRLPKCAFARKSLRFN